MLRHRVTERCEYSLSVRYTHTHTQTHTATHIKRDETRRVESAGSPLRLELFIDRNRNLQTARKLLGNYLFIYCVAVGGRGGGEGAEGGRVLAGQSCATHWQDNLLRSSSRHLSPSVPPSLYPFPSIDIFILLINAAYAQYLLCRDQTRRIRNFCATFMRDTCCNRRLYGLYDSSASASFLFSSFAASPSLLLLLA